MLAARNQDKLDSAKAGIEGNRRSCATVSIDVRDYAAVQQAIARTRAEFGPIDIVVPAAAGNFPAPAAGMSANGFKAVIDIDVLGTFNTLRAAYEHLGRPGASVLAISAAHATMPIAHQSHVCAAKAGVELLIKTLALEWGPEGIRCNCLTPGPTAETEGMRRLAPTAEAEDRIRANGAAAPVRIEGRACRSRIVLVLERCQLHHWRHVCVRWRPFTRRLVNR